MIFWCGLLTLPPACRQTGGKVDFHHYFTKSVPLTLQLDFQSYRQSTMKKPTTIRLTKIFDFEMAHALLGYDGACRNIHGHSYLLHVTVAGVPLNKPGHPKDGMVADFKDIKKVVKEKVVQVYDHALVLNEKTPEEVVSSLKSIYEKIVLKPYQPTCENMLTDMVEVIENALPSEVRLFSVRLFETATSFAEWHSED